MTRLRIGSRKSPLAMAQSEWVAAVLKRAKPDLDIEIVGLQTDGDRFLEASLQAVGGKGLFVKELQSALLARDVDLAVHSMKDMPPESPEGLMLLPFGPRENAHDALISTRYSQLSDLPEGAVVGTSSVRRQLQLGHFAPQVTVSLLRGNVNTRLAKLDAGDYDAIVLASAGLNRLQLSHRITQFLPLSDFTPACGQGILGVELAVEASGLRDLLTSMIDFDTLTAWKAEKAFQRAVGGDCHTPMAVHARRSASGGADFELFTALPDGKTGKLKTHHSTFFAAQAEQAAARALLELRA